MDVSIPCLCPNTPHGTDTVTLRDKLDFRTATTIRWAVGVENAKGAEALAVMTEYSVLYGIESWTLVDEAGQPVPVSHDAIRERLFASDQADVVGDQADILYSPRLLHPLVNRALDSMQPTPTPSPVEPPSTSATSSEPTRPSKPSKRSSTTTTRTDGIEATSSSLVGVSSFSPNSPSVR